MNYKQFKKMRIITTSFVSATVAIAIINNNILLAFIGILIGGLFIILVRKSFKEVLIDERIQSIGGKAARITYGIITIVLAFLSFFFIMIGRKAIPPQSSIEMMGITFSYIVLFNLAIYAISYKYLSKKYGEEDDE